MKRQMVLATAILGIVMLSACGTKEVSSDTKSEVAVQKEESTEDTVVEETTTYKLEEHEEDWQYFTSIGYTDWNANMPKVGEFGFTNDIYVPTVLEGKKIGRNERPYFFMTNTMLTRGSEKALGVKRVENLEEVPDLMMGINQMWMMASSSRDTMQRNTDEGINPVIETKKKVVLDGYEFMRITGKFEIFNEETKEVVREKKYIAYLTTAIPSYVIYKGYEPQKDDIVHEIYYWCEGYAKDTEGKDFDLVIETADKIMSTFKLDDDQKEILDFWKQ